MRNSKIIGLLLYLILIIVPLIIVPKSMDHFYYPKIVVIYVLVFAMIGMHALDISRRKIVFDNETKSLIVYWILIGISTLFSVDYFNSIWGSFRRVEGLITILAYGFLFIFAKSYFRWKDQYLKWIMVSATIVSLYGISQYFGFDPIPRDEIRLSWSGRAFSTIGNPNFLGTYLILMLPLGMYGYLIKRRWWLITVSSTIYLALLLTFTRSALLGIGVIFLLFVYYVFRNKKLLISFMILIGVLATITLSVNYQSDGRLLGRFISIGTDINRVIEQDEGYEKAGARRIYIWSRTMSLVVDRPLVGYGLENLGVVFVERYRNEMISMYNKVYIVDKAHNEYLHISVSTGVPSLIAYLVFLMFCLIKGVRLFLLDESYFPFIVSVFAYLVQAFFNISVVAVAFIFWIFLGMITNPNVFSEYTLKKHSK